MPTLTLTDIFASGDAPVSASSEEGGRVVRGFKVFRAGTFRDNAGVERRWTLSDLRKMTENFHTLRNSGVLPNIPVRENHSRDIRAVVGYFLDVRVEGRYLVADIEFTEPDAQGRYSRGTYRARSAEVGNYTTNDGTDYYPCILGVAFCDIPAVEGLYEAALSAYSADAGDVHILHANPDTKPADSGKPDDKSKKKPAKPADNETSPEFKTLGDAIKDILLDLHEAKDLAAGDPDTESALQQIVDALTAVVDDSNEPSDDGDENADAAGQGASKHSAGDPNSPGTNADGENPASQEAPVGLIKFTLGATEVEVDEAVKPALDAYVSSYSTVVAERDNLKAENDTLKQEKIEASFAARDARVDSWVSAKKITPAQVEPQKAFCRTLSDEQFTAHSAMVEAQPALTIATPTATGAPADETTERDKKVAEHSATLNMLKLAGVEDKRLKESKPFKALVALGITPEV